MCEKYSGYKHFDYKEFRKAPMLIHYASVGIKPWYDVYTPFKAEYMKYLNLSGFQPVRMTPVKLRKKLSLLRFTIRFNLGELKYLLKSLIR